MAGVTVEERTVFTISVEFGEKKFAFSVMAEDERAARNALVEDLETVARMLREEVDKWRTH